jgi:hypothetical protein
VVPLHALAILVSYGLGQYWVRWLLPPAAAPCTVASCRCRSRCKREPFGCLLRFAT